jgi:DNA-binding MarR family transcriptional regulator
LFHNRSNIVGVDSMLTIAAPVADFSYDTPQDAAGLPARVAIFGADAGLRGQVSDDLGGAGFRTIDGGTLAALLEGPIALLGDVVVVDCPVTGSRGLDGMMLAGLARLDMRVARSGAKLIVATNLAGLDDVFAVLDQSNPQILVSPSRAERVIAVGRVMGEAGAARLREMGEEDRIALLRLSQQVEAIAQSLDRMTKVQAATGDHRSTALGEMKRDFRGPEAVGGFGHAKAQPALPEPRIVRQIIANRQARSRFFDPELFGDPAWDMLLDLAAAHGEGAQVSVSSLCIAAGVPATTALRWLSQMVESGIFIRVPDPADRRRAFIALSEMAVAAMAGYFASLRTPLELAA